MIEIENLNFAYKEQKVLCNINTTLKLGNIYCLVGENGAGKTTLIELLLGLKKIQNGNVFFENKKVINKSILRNIGVVFQENTLRPRLKVKEEIEAYANLYNVENSWKRKIIETFRLEKFLNKLGNSLSGGERRRVLMAIAFLNKPKYVILDEPFTGVDTKVRHELRQFLAKYVIEYNSIILFSEHNILESQKYDYNFIFLYNGKVILSGTHDQISNRLIKHDYKFKDLQEMYLDIWKGDGIIENLIKE